MKVAVLYGGASSEREVSLKSGAAIMRGLLAGGFETTGFDVKEPEVLGMLDELRQYDVVFLGFHGGAGENGQLQAAFDLAGIRYTGSGHLASAVAMDKVLSKIIFEHEGIPTPRWVAVKRGEVSPEMLEKVGKLGFPLAVKPNQEGSTVGFTKVKSASELEGALELALEYDTVALCEEFIEGHEITVSLLNDVALPPVLIKPIDGLYDYEHKYTAGKTEYLCPAPLLEAVSANLMELGQKAFRALGCTSYGRVDFRLTEDYRPFCLEANTLPGMTDLSLVPKAAAAVGIGFPELLQRIAAPNL